MQNIKVEANQRLFEVSRWLLALIAMGVIIFGNYYFSQMASALKLALNLLAFLVVLAIVSFTQQGKAFWRFVQESRHELRKVVWPTKQETIHTTLVIAGVVLITALFLWAVDSILFWAMAFITGQRG